MSSTMIRYHIAAPRDVVYCTLLDPNAIAKWKVPNGMTAQVHEFESRAVGGTGAAQEIVRPGVHGAQPLNSAM